MKRPISFFSFGEEGGMGVDFFGLLLQDKGFKNELDELV
jgi:hypothetical protein